MTRSVLRRVSRGKSTIGATSQIGRAAVGSNREAWVCEQRPATRSARLSHVESFNATTRRSIAANVTEEFTKQLHQSEPVSTDFADENPRFERILRERTAVDKKCGAGSQPETALRDSETPRLSQPALALGSSGDSPSQDRARAFSDSLARTARSSVERGRRDSRQ